MSLTIDVDPLYVAARRVLLDALDALADHLSAIVVVGAQAVYLHTQDADLDASVAPHTTDADLALNPAGLAAEPQLAQAMTSAGFALKIKSDGGVEPGSWLASVEVDRQVRQVPVDLIVPATLAIGRGRRDARLASHGLHAARWAEGLEAAVVDHAPMAVSSLDPADPRRVEVGVASLPALLIAKAYKLYDRLQEDSGRPQRLRSKDAGDIIRLMRGPATGASVGFRLTTLAEDETSGQCVRTGVERLRSMFSTPRAPGVQTAVAALTGALPDEEIRALAPAFIADMLAAYTVKPR